ncbi:SRPBCC domain-containing protein [soil metagenome]
MNETKLTRDGKVLTIERVINAPKDKVWDAYTVADEFAKWFAPEGWSTYVKRLDFTPGGYLQYAMKCEDESQTEWFGQQTWGKSVYLTTSPKDGFTYKDYFCDEDGVPTEGMPVTEIEMRFEELDGKTKITSIATYESEAGLEQTLAMGMEEGMKQTFNKLASVLEHK